VNDVVDSLSGGSARLRRWLPLLLLAVVIVGALLIGARPSDTGPRTAEQRALAIADRVKCPTCRSQSVADSKAGVSRAIYDEILRRVESGQSDTQVLEYIRVTYGDDELLVPPATGAGSIVWVAPVVAVILAGAGLFVAFRKWRPVRGLEATAADRALVARAQRRDARQDTQ
jgi:cytochrome c-type biogenesis protein CcmH